MVRFIRADRWWPLLRETLAWLGALILFQAGVVQAFVVPTGSMERTILAGEVILADKITLGPRTPHWVGIPWTHIGRHVPAYKLPGLRSVQRGDIVVVETPVDPRTPFVKRVVALGGDTVELRDKALFVNGEPATDPHEVQHLDPRLFARGAFFPGLDPALGNRDNWGPFVVPLDHVFLLGDNRDFSADSRFFGPVPEENIIGRARLVAASFDRREFPRNVREAVRLSRWGRVLE